MMKILLLPILGLFITSSSSFQQYRLDIEITGIGNNEGCIMLQLMDENQRVILQEIKVPENGKCLISFKELKPGKYAVRYYHDENQNKKLDSNLVGKPMEGYGFSNNVTGKFGPPAFEKWLFELYEHKKLLLTITY